MMLGRCVARRLLTGRRSVLENGARSLSSSSEDGNPQTLGRGSDFARLVYRTLSGVGKFTEYEAKGAFVDSLGKMGQCLLFMRLQLPKNIDIDLLEFLEGAKVAAESNIRALNSVEFPEYLTGQAKTSSEVADKLKQYTTPACYNKMALHVKKNFVNRKLYVQCEGLKIEKAQLAQVQNGRMTEKEYQDMVEFHKIPTTVSPEANIELLRLLVDVATVENLKITLLCGKTRLVQHQNVYRVAFESQVNDPDKVDWRIDSMNIIEQKALSRPKDGEEKLK